MADIKISDVLHIDTPEFDPPYHDAVCISDINDFCFLLSKNRHQFLEKYNYISPLRKSDYEWLDCDRFVDCCLLLKFADRNPRKRTERAISEHDMQAVYAGLLELRKMSDYDYYEFEISSRRIDSILQELGSWLQK
ncbi:MAG: hypothetical protein LBL46_01575 [Rickettsiales bacterium]|jgi:hypothetical protein|nr:hypothetical protein [Rickettsiales bacterium]